jgi:Ca2+-binding RTX toxin-like protein
VLVEGLGLMMRTRPAQRARWLTLALGAALAALLALAPGAFATTIEFIDQGPPDPDMLIVNGSMERNEISVRYDAPSGSYVIADAAEPIAGTGCTWVSRHAQSCETTPDADVAITGQEGRDWIEVESGTPKLAAKIDGGKGKDVLRGGSGPDDISGGGGHDVIRGRNGADSLTDFGGDWYHGGRGRDILYALNRDRDRLIDCGVGEDEAAVDDNDPKPRECETVN